MNYALFADLLRNLLHVQVHDTGKGAQVLRTFAQTYCYNPALQPAFTAEALSRMTGEAQENTFYGLQDALGICVIFFLWEGRCFLVGPFVRSEYSENRIRPVLLAHHIPGSYAASVQLYYSAFPVVSSTHVRETVVGCIRAMSGKNVEYTYCRLRNVAADTPLPQPLHEESLDYSALHHRYDLENRFLRMIEQGDVENVLIAAREMSLFGLGQARYTNAVYMDAGTGLSMLRALARKAAERGGASLVEIHEITQRAVQKAYASKNVKEISKYSDAMVLELTEAVRRSRLRLGSYTLPVRRAVEYIALNYSQRLSLSDLAAVCHLSEAYLSKCFKKEVGMTLSQYIERLRCEKAAEMLRSSDAPVQEICSYVGYLDNNYFVKVFKRQFGLTPTNYRTTQRGD